MSSSPRPTPAGSIVATPDNAGTLTAMIGDGTQTVSISFNAADSQPVDELRVTAGLTDLAQGWQGPQTFACTTITTGSGCVLNLAYSPTSVESGTLTLQYEFSTAGATPVAASITIPYQATSQNNVTATVSPAGQINAVLSASAQTVLVTFTTDDGNPASDLRLSTNSAALPLGWSTSDADFHCATLGTGNGCQLAFEFSPTAVATGAFTLDYSYSDNSGTAKNGAVQIAYSSTSYNNVVGIPSPAGQVNAIVGSQRNVPITFTTDDAQPASSFVITTDLTSLPTDWTSTSDEFACHTVDTGNGCQLMLSFAPTISGPGTLTLQYSFEDNSGRSRTGSVNVAYAGTTTNTVVGTASPGGQVDATLGGSQPVQVTFTTDDGLSATQFKIESGLDALPAGWSSSGAAACSVVSVGNACQLQLTYAPTVVGSGTLSFGFSYLDNSGIARTGTINLPYAATSNNNAAATVSPSGQVAVTSGSNQAVTITFASDDGHPLQDLAVTTDLDALPAGWNSAASSVTCATVSSGSACELELTYTPTGAESGSTQISFSYVNHAGANRTGSVTIPYVAYGPHLFLASASAGIYRCPIQLNGNLSTCVLSLSGGHIGLTFVGNQAYASRFGTGSAFDLCTVEITGEFTNCVQTGGGTTYVPHSLVRIGDYMHVAYIEPGETYFHNYTVGSDGLLSSRQYLQHYNFYTNDLTFANNRLYFTNSQFNGSNVYFCSVTGTGTYTNCGVASSGLNVPQDVTMEGSRAWVSTRADDSVWTCDVSAADGTFSNCVASVPGVTSIGQIGIYNNRAYVTASTGITICDLSASGLLENCRASGQTTIGAAQMQIR